MYEDKRGCPCLIGSYFTKDQLAWIKEKQINRKTIDTATKIIGTKNLTAMTAMTVDQCYVLQDSFDMGNNETLLTNIKQILSGQRTRISNVEFKL